VAYHDGRNFSGPEAHWLVSSSKTHPRPVAIDLFAGCGAASLGLRRAGYVVSAAVEIDPRRARTYQANHPKTKVFVGDIREVEVSAIRRAVGHTSTIALVAGCPPCQGFSRIRRRNASVAAADARNDLVLEFGRFVRALQPHAFMMENVPGLEQDPRYTQFLRSLRGAGYSIDWRILDLAEYGVPQRRRRLVVIGWKDAGVKPDLSLIRTGPARCVRDVLARLPRMGPAARSLHRFRVQHSSQVRERIRNVPRNGGSRFGWRGSLTLDCHTKSTGFRDVYGRMSWDKPAPTITGGCVNPSKGRFLHPSLARAISVIEAARLQTFPIWYRFDPLDGRYPIAEMIGEALPPLFAQRAGAYILDQLSPR
jgi:DNA (cytosine-5)-methyltransferase 1